MQSHLEFEQCKSNKAARHPTKCDVINDVKLFPPVYRTSIRFQCVVCALDLICVESVRIKRRIPTQCEIHEYSKVLRHTDSLTNQIPFKNRYWKLILKCFDSLNWCLILFIDCISTYHRVQNNIVSYLNILSNINFFYHSLFDWLCNNLFQCRTVLKRVDSCRFALIYRLSWQVDMLMRYSAVQSE